MSEIKYKDGFYSQEDFFGMLSDIRKLLEAYDSGKHGMDLLTVIEKREELAIINSELGDIGADLFYDKQRTEAEYRLKLLRRQEELEEEMSTEGINPKTGKKWTNMQDRARYKAELECEPERKAADDAKRIHTRAYYLYAKTIPDVLNAMSSRISFLIRLMPLAQATEQEAEETTKTLPAARKYREENDGFDDWNVARNVGKTFEDLEEELGEEEPEVI